MPGGSGKEKPWSSARVPSEESSCKLMVLLSTQRTTPEPTAPPGEGDEVVVDEVPVGNELANSSGLEGSPSFSAGHCGACRRDGADEAPVDACEPWSARNCSMSSASKLICCGRRMPANVDEAQADPSTQSAAKVRAGILSRCIESGLCMVVRRVCGDFPDSSLSRKRFSGRLSTKLVPRSMRKVDRRTLWDARMRIARHFGKKFGKSLVKGRR